MENIEILVDQTQLQAVQYPSLCVTFINRAQGLYDMLPQIHMAIAIENNIHPTTADQFVTNSIIAQMELLESGRKYAAKASGWGLIASVLPSQTAKAFCIGKKNSLIIEYAERTTEFLAPQIGQERVAKLLPIELRTEQAATYMHQRQRFALEAVIHKSIALK